MHGGTNPGAPVGNSNARQHGGYSAETMMLARYLRAVAREVNKERFLAQDFDRLD